MASEEDWLFRPAGAPWNLCTYREIDGGMLSLTKIADMNEIISVRIENERRWQEWLEANRPRNA